MHEGLVILNKKSHQSGFRNVMFYNRPAGKLFERFVQKLAKASSFDLNDANSEGKQAEVFQMMRFSPVSL